MSHSGGRLMRPCTARTRARGCLGCLLLHQLLLPLRLPLPLPPLQSSLSPFVLSAFGLRRPHVVFAPHRVRRHVRRGRCAAARRPAVGRGRGWGAAASGVLQGGRGAYRCVLACVQAGVCMKQRTCACLLARAYAARICLGARAALVRAAADKALASPLRGNSQSHMLHAAGARMATRCIACQF